MTTRRKRLTAQQARTVIEGAVLAKAPDWSDTRRWHVTAADGEVLVVVTPSYGGTGASGRNGWQGAPAGHGIGTGRPHRTREDAAVAGLASWQRLVTSAG